MKISDLRIDRDGTSISLSALIDSERVSLVYGQQLELNECGDAFIVIAIAVAMEREECLIVEPDIQVSPSLLARLSLYQEVYSAWWPQARPIAIEANVQNELPQNSGRTGCFFSGGIDGLFSAIRHQKSIDDLILCRGLDIPFNEGERWIQTVRGVTAFANALGLNVLCVETDAKKNFTSTKGDNHGALLISTALPVGFRRLIVPASLTYKRLYPWGSHPLTDPFLSSMSTEIIHDGAVPRSEKVKFIVQSGVPLDHLRVCNRFTLYNCGVCEKCIRTEVALEILGARTPSLPALDLRALRKVEIQNVNLLGAWRDNLILAREYNRIDIAQAIEEAISRFTIREGLRAFDSRWSGGIGIRLLRSARNVRKIR